MFCHSYNACFVGSQIVSCPVILSLTAFTQQTDNPFSKSVKIDGWIDGQSHADCSSQIKTVPFSN